MNLREKLLKSTDDAKKAIKVPFQVRKDRKKLESWVIDREEEVANLELKIEEKKAKDDLDIDGILDAMDDLELANRRLSQGQKLLAELFDEDVSTE